jgi:hypothetical protein
MTRHNLFQFATQEPAHAALWAWIFQATDAEEDALSGPKAVGESAVRLLDGPIPDGEVHVDTEVSLSSGARADVCVDFADGHTLVVEFKKRADFDDAQIERYREALDEDDQVALISTRFDADAADGVCPYLGLDDVRELLWAHREDHPLLSDYADWLDARKETRQAIEQDAFADDPAAVAEALSTLYGQVLVMDALTASMEGWTKSTHENTSGSPYTEFRFAEQGPNQDALFYRIDEYAAGHHVSLKQYLPSRDAAAWDDKEGRLERLRAWWTEAAEQTNHRLSFRAPHNYGSKTREVACLPFADNPPSVVVEDLPAIHEAFTRSLAQNGWSLDGQS